MSSLFGGGGGGRGRDPDLVAANRRRQRALARDIGDEQALAREDQPRYRRPRIWLMIFVAVLLIAGGFQTFRHKGGGVPITRSCTSPAFSLEAGIVTPHGKLDWTGTGPAADHYVLVADGTPVDTTSTSGQVAVNGGQALSPVFVMPGCIVHSTFVAPDAAGKHEVRLFQRTSSGFTQVAKIKLTVAGS